MGEAKEREDGEKVFSPKSHEIKALSWDMENNHPRECRSLGNLSPCTKAPHSP